MPTRTTQPGTRFFWILAIAALAVGCSDRATDSPLSHAYRSPEALANAALTAIQEGNEDELARLMVTREEYEELLWPVLPDREQMPFEFVWSITGPRSRKARREALDEYKGLPLELVRVELSDEADDVEPYDEFTLYRRSRMIVRRIDTGAEGPMPLMDTLVEMGGGWKFVNFREN